MENLITSNFWILLMVLLLLTTRKTRLASPILVSVIVCFGVNSINWAIVLLSIILSFLLAEDKNDKKTLKKYYEAKYKSKYIEDKLSYEKYVVGLIQAAIDKGSSYTDVINNLKMLNNVINTKINKGEKEVKEGE